MRLGFMKKILCMALAGALLLLGAACGNSSDASSESVSLPSKGLKICASFPTMGDAYAAAVNANLRDYAKQNGNHVITLDPGGSLDTQILQIEDMLTEGIDIMVLSPVDGLGIRPALEALQAAQVPVILLGDTLDASNEELIATRVVPNYAFGAQLLAERLLEQMPDGGTSMVFGQAGDVATQWENSLSSGEAWQQLPLLEAETNVESALAALRAFWEEAEQKPGVIFATSETAALAALQFMQESGMKEGQILLYSVGGGATLRAQIEAGWIAGAAMHHASAVSGKAIEAASALYSKQEVPKITKADVALVTLDNLPEFAMENWG